MDEENELIALRRKKLDALRAKGVEPFSGRFEVAGSIADVREKFKEGETLRVAGRIIARVARTEEGATQAGLEALHRGLVKHYAGPAGGRDL